MPTIIDALIVTLGLDAKSYLTNVQKAKEAQAALSADEAKASRDAEAFAKKRADAYRRIGTEVLGLYAIFTAGRSIGQFVRDLTVGDAALGRLAYTTGMTTESLSAWEGAVESAGGSAAALDGTVDSLTQQLQQMSLTGQAGPSIAYFRAVGVSVSDANGHMRSFGDIALDAADKLHSIAQNDPARATAIGRGMGFDQATLNVILRGRPAVEALLEAQRRLGAVSRADAEAAAARLAVWHDLETGLTAIGRTVLTAVTPALLAAGNALDQFLQNNRIAISNGIIEAMHAIAHAVGEVVTWFYELDWTAIGAEARGFADGVMAAVRAVISLVTQIRRLATEFSNSPLGRMLGAVTPSAGTAAENLPGVGGIIRLGRFLFNPGGNSSPLTQSPAGGVGAGNDESARENRENQEDAIARGTARANRERPAWLDELLRALNPIGTAAAAEPVGQRIGTDGRGQPVYRNSGQQPAPTSASGGSGNTFTGASNGPGSPSDAAFVARYGGLAQQVGSRLGVSPSVILAQLRTEIGSGGDHGNNPFNVQAGAGWTGATVTRGDRHRDGTPYSTQFRAYNSLEESGADVANLIRSRYPQAMNTGEDAMAYARGLQNGVGGRHYAEAPNYPDAIAAQARRMRAAMSGAGAAMPNIPRATPTPARQGQLQGASNNVSSDTRFGDINITTAANTSREMMTDFSRNLQRYGMVVQANTGLTS